jgi:phosphatidylserine/phosphatidylglycerophosphate/cardiolipin synthase-like enzyme
MRIKSKRWGGFQVFAVTGINTISFAISGTTAAKKGLPGFALERSDPKEFARETSARALGLNTHVAFIHSKFLLMDPLGADPVIVTGSANFSDASTNANDEKLYTEMVGFSQV